MCAVLPSAAAELEEQAAAEVDSLMEIYEHLHTYPELSYQEKESAALVARELRKLGFEVTEEVGDYGFEGRTSYGVVGVMRNGDGPTVMVRTDLDALPIEEKTGLPYASRAKGVSDSGSEVLVMQACGHDLHMTTFVGTARMLARIKDRWSGTLVMIGQPAEERGAGARAMLDDGLFERFPKPEYALAFHANAEMPAGTVGMLSGYALANVDSVDITIRGRGGHGAYPHKTKDPVTLAAQVIVNLQPIVSRQVSPFDPAVVTVGSIHGGTKHNIIPDEVHLQLTVRSYKPEVRDHLLSSIRLVAEDTARAAGFPDELLPVVELAEEEYTPSTYNDPALVERLAGVIARTLGEDRVTWVEPVMAGEDFARYGLDGKIPIAIMWLGAVEPAKFEDYARRGQQLPGLHSAEFTVFPEPAIRTGVTAMTAAVLDLMRP
ncbi:MAG: amidohydrolase [Thermoanaerobaculia bacterium]